MRTSESEIIRWIVPPCPQRAAKVYTVRLLSSLLGLRSLVEEGPTPVAEGMRTVVYDQVGEAGLSKVFGIEPDIYFWSRVEAQSDITPLGVSEWRGTPFPRWAESGVSRKSHAANAFVCPVDPIAAAFFLVSRIEEWRSTATDQHGRYRADEAWMTRMGLLERPLVHEFAGVLAEWLGIESPFELARSRWPSGHPFALAFTHDIDRLRLHGKIWGGVGRPSWAASRQRGFATFTRRIGSAFAVRLGGRKDPYDTFDEILAGHRAHGNQATFFWMSTRPSSTDADYAPDDPKVSATLDMIRDAGHEIGLHGSYGSFEDAEVLTQQKAGLEKAAGAGVTSTRQHFLRFKASSTWEAQVRAGLSADSTLGFSSRLGFRAGIAVPFQPWDFVQSRPYDLWEVPMVMMEVTAREYMGLGPDEAIARSQRILAQVERVGGAVSVLWHNSSLNDLDWRGWQPVYESWLAEARAQNAWGATVRQIVEAYARNLRDLEF